MTPKKLSPSMHAVTGFADYHYSQDLPSETNVGNCPRKEWGGGDGAQPQYPTRSDKGDQGRAAKLWRSSDPLCDRDVRPRPRSATVRRANTIDTMGSIQSSSGRMPDMETTGATRARDAQRDSSNPSQEEGEDAEEAGREQSKEQAEAPCHRLRSSSLGSTLTAWIGMANKTSDSGSSSDSGSTITQTAFAHGDSSEDDGQDDKASGDLSTPAEKPDPMSFLDPDSPAITEESIQRTVAEAAKWRSPSTRSSSSSSTSSSHSGGSVSTADTDLTASPDRSMNGDMFGATLTPTTTTTFTQTSDYANKSAADLKYHTHKRQQRTQNQSHRYGTPEMPRGTAVHPHLPPSALQPRVPNQGHAKHLPRAEKLPLTGYELLASRLSSRGRSRPHLRPASRLESSHSSSPGSSPTDASRARRGSVASVTDREPPLKPIYRRFEALNHRLLLHLQDELSELEEQLHRLDTADTQTRRLQNCILPASRRAEYMAGGELQWHRTDILGKIGFKLGQYNHVLSSFTSTQTLPSPALSDVDAYRNYLATAAPVAEIETRFLDPVDDLVSLAATLPSAGSLPSTPEDHPASEYFSSLSDDALTPMPLPRKMSHSSSHAAFLATSPSPGPGSSASSAVSRAATEEPETDQDELVLPLPRLALALAAVVLVPVLAFAVIPGFVGRMTVVLLAGLAVAGMHVQAMAGSGGGVGYTARDLALCATVYGGVMAVVAAAVR